MFPLCIIDVAIMCLSCVWWKRETHVAYIDPNVNCTGNIDNCYNCNVHLYGCYANRLKLNCLK